MQMPERVPHTNGVLDRRLVSCMAGEHLRMHPMWHGQQVENVQVLLLLARELYGGTLMVVTSTVTLAG